MSVCPFLMYSTTVSEISDVRPITLLFYSKTVSLSYSQLGPCQVQMLLMSVLD